MIADKLAHTYADGARVRPIQHAGEHYRVAGPHLTSPSPQRTPLLIQAGWSGRGRQFAAKHAELVVVFFLRLDGRGSSDDAQHGQRFHVGRLTASGLGLAPDIFQALAGNSSNPTQKVGSDTATAGKPSSKSRSQRWRVRPW